MRAMDEDCGGNLSEDEHPSTDASEDSVEVQVRSIASFPSNLSRLPRKFRKAFQKNLSATEELSTTFPQDFTKNSQDFRKRSPNFTISCQDFAKSPQDFRKRSQDFTISCQDFAKSPQDFRERSQDFTKSCQPSEVDDHLGCSTPRSAVDISFATTGRVSPPLPSSPPLVQKTRGNKRKLSEPRRVIEKVLSHEEEEWTPRKALKVQENIIIPPKVQQEINTTVPLLRPNPFIGHLVPPHLLVSPVWNPAVTRYPYAHLVGLAPQLGFAPYPLLPILPPRVPIIPQNEVPVVLPMPCAPSASDVVHRKTSKQISSKESSKSSSLRLKNNCESLVKIKSSPEKIIPTGSTSSGNHIVQQALHQKPLVPKDTSKKFTKSSFLSVESLISPVGKQPPAEVTTVEPTEEDSVVEFDCTTEGTIQSLLQIEPKQKQRNYKNMTRERRIEANARERTRVHTISAAFETLRQAVPSFSHNQKLSKLSVLRIASTYILSLSRLSGQDYSEGETSPSFEECVDLTTKTIQIEGKAKKKRED